MAINPIESNKENCVQNPVTTAAAADQSFASAEVAPASAGDVMEVSERPTAIDAYHAGTGMLIASGAVAGSYDIAPVITSEEGNTAPAGHMTGASEVGKLRQASTPTFLAHVRKIVTDNEGRRPHVYTDTQGHPTVGIGFNLDRAGARAQLKAVGADYDAIRAGKTSLTDKQIDQLFSSDLARAEHDARRLVKSYDQLAPARRGVLTDMMFNLGSKQFAEFKSTIRAIESGDFSQAAHHMANSGWYEQTGDRAKRDVVRMQTANW